jgi:predicted flavoprotein YhiN
VIAHAPRRFEDARARLIDPSGRTVFDYRGEIDCERFGLSGAAVYNAQRFLSHYGDGAEKLKLEVEFGGEKLAFVNLKSRPLKEAIVTIGGVATDEIDPHTMESKIVPHLYFAGEVIDIDGPTGGYNLTLAFATARKAVLAVQRQLNSDIRSRTAQR